MTAESPTPPLFAEEGGGQDGPGQEGPPPQEGERVSPGRGTLRPVDRPQALTVSASPSPRRPR